MIKGRGELELVLSWMGEKYDLEGENNHGGKSRSEIRGENG